MKASDLLVRCLEQEGVRSVFALPGEENLDLVESFRTSTIELIVCRHEQAAGFMAATTGRLTGRAGVCLTTLGPGAANLVTAAAHAHLGAMPMVMITGQKPIKHSKQGEFQIIDVVDMLQPVSKYTRQIASADLIPARVREAFRFAEEERPGPAHLELPEDIASDESEESPLPSSYSRRPLCDDKAIDRAIAMLREARHPLLVLGAGANRKATCNMISRFVERSGIPFATTQMGKGVVDEHHTGFIGCAALSSGDFVHRAIASSDLIVNVGHDVVEKPPFLMRRDGPRVIHVNYVSARVDPVYFPQLELVGDIANSFWRLGEQLAPQKHWDFSFFMKARSVLNEHIGASARLNCFPMAPQRIVRDVEEALGGDGYVALDNGLYKLWFARNYRARHSNAVLLDNALATMGAGLPAAIATSRLQAGQRVLAVCGDGGFMMTSQELETAVRLELDLVVVVLRDDAYGMIRWKQRETGFPDFGLSFGNVDFVAYAQAYAAKGHRIADPSQLSDTLRKCFDEGGVHLVEVPVDYTASNRVLSEEIGQLSAALER